MVIGQLLAGILAETDEGNSLALLILGPLGAAGVYLGLYRYYRNTDKSHSFEHETRIEAQPPTGNDQKVDEIKGTRKTGIDGDNRSKHRQRVNRV